MKRYHLRSPHGCCFRESEFALMLRNSPSHAMLLTTHVSLHISPLHLNPPRTKLQGARKRPAAPAPPAAATPRQSRPRPCAARSSPAGEACRGPCTSLRRSARRPPWRSGSGGSDSEALEWEGGAKAGLRGATGRLRKLRFALPLHGLGGVSPGAGGLFRGRV